jgi:hypothetical protein
MATKHETNTSELPAFSTIKDHEKRAVILKAEGKTMEQVTAHINNEFVLEYSVSSVKEWFYAGGRLEQAYSEYLEASAHIALKETRLLIKRASKAAAANMIAKINSPDDRVSLDASRHLLNKYVPDRQIVSDAPEPETDLPDELQAVANSLREGDDGQKPVDEPPVGEPDSPAPGA